MPAAHRRLTADAGTRNRLPSRCPERLTTKSVFVSFPPGRVIGMLWLCVHRANDRRHRVVNHVDHIWSLWS